MSTRVIGIAALALVVSSAGTGCSGNGRFRWSNVLPQESMLLAQSQQPGQVDENNPAAPRRQQPIDENAPGGARHDHSSDRPRGSRTEGPTPTPAGKAGQHRD